MSTERVIIHLPDDAANIVSIYHHVLTHSTMIDQATSKTLHLFELLSEALTPHKVPVKLVGTNCIVISDYEEQIPAILRLISPLLLDFSTLTVLESAKLIWTSGDEDAEFSIETAEYAAPWASLNSLPHWIDWITANARAMAELGIGKDPRDFFLVRDAIRHQTYIQTYFNPIDEAYRVEMRLGNARQHYACTCSKANTVVREIEAWMNTRTYTTDGWQKLDLEKSDPGN